MPIFFLRVRSISPEKVPPSGPVILAPNHFSFMDHFLIGAFIRRKVRFMAKSQLFKRPMQFIYTHGGVFPVRRGVGDEETFITAETILARGGAVTMYCEGGRSRTGKLAEQAKRGIGRLALETGAPIVPIAIHGSSRIRNWKRLQFPKVTVQYGEPIRWERVQDPTREQQQAVADEILVEIRRLYAGLEAHGRVGVLRPRARAAPGPSVARGSPCSSRARRRDAAPWPAGGSLRPPSRNNGTGCSARGSQWPRHAQRIGSPRAYVCPRCRRRGERG